MRRASKILFATVVLLVGLGAAGVAILKSMDFNAYRDLIAEKVEEATGRKVVIAGDLDLRISLTPSLRLEGVSLANAPWGAQPEMLKLGRLEAEVDLMPLLSGEARVTRVFLSGVEIALEIDKQGRPNWQFETKEPSVDAGAAEAEGATRLPITPVVKNVIFENVKLSFSDAASGQSFETVLHELTVRSEGAGSPVALRGKGKFGEAPYEFDGNMGAFAALLGGESFPIAFQASAFGARIGVEGAVGKPLEGTGIDMGVTLDFPDIASSLQAVADVLPALKGAAVPALPLKISARASQTKSGYALDELNVAIGKSDLTGAASVDIVGARPSLSAELNSKRFDVAAILDAMPAAESPAESAKAGAAKNDGKPKRVFPAVPLSLEGLGAADANVSLKIGEVILPGGLGLQNTVVTVVLEKGRLKISPFNTMIADGTIDGQVTLDASGSKAALNTTIKGDDVVAGRLLEQLQMSDLMEGGKIDIDIGLKGSGGSVAQLMAGLNGEFMVEVGEGKLRTAALDLAGADVLMQLVDALNPAGEKKNYSILSCAVVRFKIKNGVAKAENGIAIETDRMNVVGGGTVDLGKETLDLAVKPEAKEGVGINLSGALAGLVRVKGTLAEPSVGLDEIGAAKTAASVGAALATGGLSILGEALISGATRDEHPCLTALGKAPPPKAAKKTGGSTQSAPAPAKKETKRPASVLEGVGNALGGLFGGKKK
ncbi:MAG: AsmA family protein [Rhodospirillales bacterium]|nr:AsmA family protein [Rhodospirillales bacterium]